MFRFPKQETPIKSSNLFLETKQAQESCFVSIVSSITCFNSDPNRTRILPGFLLKVGEQTGKTQHEGTKKE